jgi:hypothetical protein
MTPYELLCDLAACLCAELTPEGAPGPDLCFCGIAPGQQFAEDYIWGCDTKCGSAWVRLITAYPADGVGAPADGVVGCGRGLGVDIEIGVLRCVEQPGDGSAPTEEMLAAASVAQMNDLLAVRRMIACCPSLNDVDYSLGVYTPVGPRGAVVGGRWTLSVLLT